MDPYLDVTLRMLDCDWRAITNCPHRAPPLQHEIKLPSSTEPHIETSKHRTYTAPEDAFDFPAPGAPGDQGDLHFLEEINALDFGQVNVVADDDERGSFLSRMFSPQSHDANAAKLLSMRTETSGHILTDLSSIQQFQAMLNQERMRSTSETEMQSQGYEPLSLKKESSSDAFFVALVNSEDNNGDGAYVDRNRANVDQDRACVHRMSDHGKRTAAEISSEEHCGVQLAKSEDLKHRNRQSAKASRERKKAKFDYLHAQVTDLTERNSELQQTLHEVRLDNDQLKAELTGLGYKGDFTDLGNLVKSTVAEHGRTGAALVKLETEEETVAL